MKEYLVAVSENEEEYSENNCIFLKYDNVGDALNSVAEMLKQGKFIVIEGRENEK